MERAAGVARPLVSRLRRASLEHVHNVHKHAWADEEDEPGPLCIHIAETWSSRKGQMRVGFDEKVTVHHVLAYSENLRPASEDFCIRS